ncbi:MAG TPA: hypothetical protein VGR00_13985 [Thermoanaerobaculia bacterium]|jgi:hypothetical protein|nr:hypothetical protein [Thermoanaerobaculia bacterium]
MAVKWVGDAARELGIDTLTAVELLAAKQNYPYNGLLDEDRFFLLKHDIEGKKPAAAVAQPSPAATQSVTPTSADVRGGRKEGPSKGKRDRDEITSVTSPIPQMPDKAEERTVIIPPPLPER